MKKYFTISNPFLILAIIFAALLIFQIVVDNDWANKLSAGATAVAALGGMLLMVFTFQYLQATRDMVNEMRKQNEPAVTVKIVNSKDSKNDLNVWIKNTGGSPAYNVSINFDPDLPYYGTYKSLNELPIFKHMPYLEKNEEIEFFYATAPHYFENQNNPLESTVTIKYSGIVNSRQELKRQYKINLKEGSGQSFLTIYSLSELVEEIIELKQGIFMFLSEMREEKNKYDKK